MHRLAILPLAVLAASGASAQPAQAPQRGPTACLPAQTVVPPFNNTAGAMEQSRIAATILMDGRARAGERRIPVCRTSAVAPEISAVEGVNEVPVDPDYEPEDSGE